MEIPHLPGAQHNLLPCMVRSTGPAILQSLMPTTVLPEWVIASLTQLGNMPEKEYRALLRILGSGTSTLSTSAVAKSLAENSQLDIEDADMLLHALVGLAGMGYAQDITGDKLAGQVTVSPELDQVSIDTNTLADRIARLIDGSPLRLLGKARDLKSEHAHIFLDGRVITDIRPIFGVEDDGQPEGALLSHTLKLEFIRDQGEVEHFYLTLDEDDLDKLNALIRRAKQKATSLRSVLSRVDITHVGVES